MSQNHPIVAITGASGAGTTVVKKSFINIFIREGVNPAFVEGESFRRYDCTEMQNILKQAREQ